VSFLARRHRFPGIRRRIHLYGHPAWWLRIMGWLAFGVPLSLLDVRLAPIGPVAFEVGFQILSWWQYRKQLWRAVSGEAAFLASRGVDIVTGADEILTAAGNRRQPIERALQEMLNLPETVWKKRAIQMLRISLSEIDR